MNEVVQFKVSGKPATAGSKRAFHHRHTGRIVVVDDCKGGKPWRKLVQAQASTKCRAPMVGPLRLAVIFVMPRPLSHRKKDGAIAKGAPQTHTVKPDATKLLRAVEDALTGIAWIDDAQIVEQYVSKRYAQQDESPGALIAIAPLGEP
jgi:Holliday junction resolvase RusA-like endonuclease